MKIEKQIQKIRKSENDEDSIPSPLSTALVSGFVFGDQTLTATPRKWPGNMQLFECCDDQKTIM